MEKRVLCKQPFSGKLFSFCRLKFGKPKLCQMSGFNSYCYGIFVSKPWKIITVCKLSINQKLCAALVSVL